MKHLFKPQVFQGILAFLLLLLVVKLLWLSLQILWLPSQGVDHVSQKGDKALYYRVKLTPNEAAPPSTKPSKKPVKRSSGSIKDIKLLAIYNASDVTVVTVKYKAKNKVLSRGDAVNGFVLEGAGNDFATFSKKSKSYKVQLFTGKKAGKNNRITAAKASGSSVPKKFKRKKSASPEGNITDATGHKIIDRSLLKHYAENLEAIQKDIGVTQAKGGDGPQGFRITFVRKDSHLAKLGVKRNDVIMAVNGQEISNPQAGFEIYKNIQNTENLTLLIKRGKEEMELEYEVK